MLDDGPWEGPKHVTLLVPAEKNGYKNIKYMWNILILSCITNNCKELLCSTAVPLVITDRLVK
jgi:hypothetical protein